MLHRNFCDSLQSRPDKVLGNITGGLASTIPFTMFGKVGSTISKIDKLVPDEVIGASKSGLRTWQEAGISPSDALRIQNAANKSGQEIIVVGSHAKGTASITSDWDYILSGNSSKRHSVRNSLQRGTHGGEINSMGNETGIDIWQNYNPKAKYYNPLDVSKPHVIFSPNVNK